MNNVLSLKNITEQLSKTANIEYSAAEAFVTAYFKSIEQVLAEGEPSVTLKGLGVFSNENGSVKFTPDSQLADAVNAPFSFFTPMMLNDDELVAEPEMTKVEEVIAETVADEDSKPQLEPEPEINDVTEVEPESVEETEEVAQEEPEEEVAQEEPEEEADVDTKEEADIDTAVEDNGEETVAVSEPVESAEPQIVHHYHHRGRVSRLSTVLLFIAGLLIGGVIGYFAHNNIQRLVNDEQTPMPKQNVVIDADTVTIVRPNSVIVEKEQAPDTIKEDTASVKPSEKPAEEAPVAKEPEVKPKRYDTVGGRVYLATLARKYYGHGEYWVYIFKANKLKHPDRVKPGTRLLIPYIEDVRTSKDDSINLANAKRRGAEIYAKCK